MAGANVVTPVIDAHHHFWQAARQEQAWRDAEHRPWRDAERPVIAADYEAAQLAPELSAAGVDATVLVESVDCAEENNRLASYAANAGFVAGVVAWLPLADPRAAERELDRIAGMPALRGVRCLVGRTPLDWLGAPPTRAVLADLANRGLSWDVVPVTPQQVDAVIDVACAIPHLRIIVDHLARPPVDVDGWDPWAGQLAELAGCQGVALKVSVGIDVLRSWQSWSVEGLTRYVAHAVECFGTSRLMMGSNWPVVLLRRSYPQVWGDLSTAVRRAGLDGAELGAVAGRNAVRWYRLDGTAALTMG